jgi:hypothetical protein
MNFHGTKIIVFNLWFNDEREMELDFMTDKEVGFDSPLPSLSHSYQSRYFLLRSVSWFLFY